ncbi:MAG: outer membrane beta-barrel protein [Cyclobacteriaceae bacterium]|nr:outer membrane beta-barrel protein [Cyclobacteriaceae bacterium]
MNRLQGIILGLCLALQAISLHAQNVESFGIFGGLNVPITIDQGLSNDPRFISKFSLRGTPVGFYYGYDRPGLGFFVSPNYLTIGQSYIIANTTGGHVGTRDINMNYLSVPVGLKFHLNSMAFFRLSLVAALDFSFLLDATETFTHSAAKLRYPAGVSVPTDPGYTVVYDGVFVPQVSNLVHVSKDKFNSFQLFGGVGMRFDLDLSDNWSVMADGRANFGLLDPRSEDYVNQLKNPAGPPDVKGNPGAPDLYGSRRDVFLSFTLGVARIITTKPKFKARQSAPIPKMTYPKAKKK